MRKIVVGAQVSMDGIMQAPGGPLGGSHQGFTFGGWVMPYLDPVFGEEIDRVEQEEYEERTSVGSIWNGSRRKSARCCR